MVFVNDMIAASFAIQLKDLEQHIHCSRLNNSPELGFAQYVCVRFNVSGLLTEILIERWPSNKILRHAPELALVGYELALKRGRLCENLQEQWLTGYERVISKELFPADRQSFVYRPIEVLGIALGISTFSISSRGHFSRFFEILEHLENENKMDDWSTGIYGLAAETVGKAWKLAINPQFENLSVEVLALIKILLDIYPNSRMLSSVVEQKDNLILSLLSKCATSEISLCGVDRATVVYCVLKEAIHQHIKSDYEKSWPVNRQAIDALNIVVNLCKRFPLFVRQIQERRKDVAVQGDGKKQPRSTIGIKDEYDVQDALHAILRLHFDDVRPEEWVPSYAATQSRMDFLLKQEKIVIETKMTRDNIGQKEIVEQLAVDKERYRAHPDCKMLVCFVYDPSCRCKNPVALENDTRLEGEGLRVIVIVAPKGL